MEARAAPLIDGLRAPDGLLANYIRPKELDSMIQRHRGGVVDATDRLWRLLNLQIWGDVFLTGKRERWDGLVSRPRTVSTVV